MTGRAQSRVVALALLAFGSLGAALVACGGDDSSALGGGPGGPTGGDDGGHAGDATIGHDGSAVGPHDAGIDTTPLPLNSYDAADIPEGGLKVTQGVVGCGEGETCNAFAGNQCCVGGDQDGAACVATSVACAPGASSIECNESADCTVGTVCCGDVTAFDGGYVLTTRCKASCGAGAQLCRTNGECAYDAGDEAGGPAGCVLQQCSDGMQYEMCGVYQSAPDAAVPFACNP